MVRGEYRFDTGEIVSNQFTPLGLLDVAKCALQKSYTTSWDVGFCYANIIDNLVENQLNEPTIGINGYNRVTLVVPSVGGWAGAVILGKEVYVQQLNNMAFLATGIGWDKPVNRMFIINSTTTALVSMSAALSTAITVVANINVKYRLWFR